jgi:AraC family transcriptional regulator, transcriptional activator of pobA
MAANNNHNDNLGFPEGFSLLELNNVSLSKGLGTTRRNWNTVIYVTGGNGVLQIDFDEFIAFKYRIFFIEKYKIWSLIKVNGLKGYMVQFTDTFYNYIYTGNPKLKSDQTLVGEVPPFIRIHPRDKTGWESVFNILSHENELRMTNSKEIICLNLKLLILMYRRNSFPSGVVFDSRRKKQLVNEFRKLVNNRFSSFRSAKDYAHALNITPNYLNALCQEFFLKSVSEIIVERIILEAKRMLMHSSLSVSEIAYKLGFKDNSYFGRFFKKEVGMTPVNFRVTCFNTSAV